MSSWNYTRRNCSWLSWNRHRYKYKNFFCKTSRECHSDDNRSWFRVAAPTVIKEPEKPAEETPVEGAEGETSAEGAEAAKESDAAKKDEKGKDGASDKKPEEKKPTEKKPADKK